MTDQELKDLVASLAIETKELKCSYEEIKQLIKDNGEQQKKTDEQIKKTDEQIKDTAEQIKNTDKQIQNTAEQIKNTDKQLKRTDEQLKRTDEKLNRMGSLLGNISNNQGDVAEEFFYNSLKDKRDLANIHYDRIDKNITSSVGDIQDEFDIIMVNGNDVVIIEVKYKAHEKDLERFLTKKYPNFKALYPMYKNYKHHLGLASFFISDDLKNRALDQGVMVLQRKGNVVETFLKK